MDALCHDLRRAEEALHEYKLRLWERETLSQEDIMDIGQLWVHKIHMEQAINAHLAAIVSERHGSARPERAN